jgi:CRISPR-associated protein Csm4
VKATLFRLVPRGPFHFGPDANGEPAPVVASDTLFSALCFSLRDLFGPMRLASFFRIIRSAAEAPPLRFSSAVPYAGEVLFLPNPAGTGWVSQRLFEAQANGEPLGETRQAQDGRLTFASDERLPVSRVWAVEEVRRARVGIGGVEPFVDRLVRYAPGCGLGVLAQIDPDWQDDIVAALRALGDAGIGGRRSWGAGQFEVAIETVEIREPGQAERYCTLSHYLPTARELEGGVLNPPARYQLEDRGGWTAGQSGSVRHRTIRMVATGSVLNAPYGRPPVGRLAEVTPAGFRNHEVLRAGWALPIGLAGAA